MSRFSGSPDRNAVFKSLDRLLRKAGTKGRTVKLIVLDPDKDRYIIFSDQHKGNGDRGDDFRKSEANYIYALQTYHAQGYTFINLGDSEELWKYDPPEVIAECSNAFRSEAAFQAHQRYIKVFGNHDLFWRDDRMVRKYLYPHFDMPLPVWESVLLRVVIDGQPLQILLTHGHQGDRLSDNNALSAWFVAHIWAPIQRYLGVNVNTPGTTSSLRNTHNRMMYEWSSTRKDTLLITGHTHQPVFASGFYSDHPGNRFDKDERLPLQPTYFNSGCCCFNDGDITGIEIEGGYIRLVKWYDTSTGGTDRQVLEEVTLSDLRKDLS